MQTLFTVETPRLRLTWSGPRARSEGTQPLTISGLGGADVRLHEAEALGDTIWLEEETAYSVLVQSLDGSPVRLHHSDPVVTSGLVSADGGRVLHGRLSFGSQAGRARFELMAGSTVEAEVSVSVLPVKLGEREVAVMRAEVEAFAAGLAVAAIRPAHLEGESAGSRPSAPVWLTAIRQGVGDLTAALREIDRHPVVEVRRERTELRTDRITRPSGETRRAVRQWPTSARTLLVRAAHVTTDTDAHRWLADRIGRMERELRSVLREERRRRSSQRRRVLIGEVEDLSGQLALLRRFGVFEGVVGRAPVVPPLVLRRRPGYAAAYAAIRRVERGLALRSGDLHVATQDLAVLYETWSALALVRSLARVLGVDPPSRPFGVEARGADVRLRRGRAHAVRLDGRGLRAEVVYNPRFPAPPGLLAQRPDLLVTLVRGGTRTRLVLDAKYRRDDSARYRRRYGAAGPPEDALNTLHRYRDAVPGVSVAVALFPGASKGFTSSRLWTSLGSLGVGAIPLRPGDEDALADFLSGLV